MNTWLFLKHDVSYFLLVHQGETILIRKTHHSEPDGDNVLVIKDAFVLSYVGKSVISLTFLGIDFWVTQLGIKRIVGSPEWILTAIEE
jgi:hypothetical protein